jgi:hypothetical protein
LTRDKQYNKLVKMTQQLFPKRSEIPNTFNSYLEVQPDGTVRVPGIDYSNRTPMTVAAMTDDTIVVVKPSGSCWNGVGQPHVYVPAKYMVFKIVKTTKIKNSSARRIDVEGLIEFGTRAKNIVTDVVKD